jgi:hypothetical protein
LDGQTGRASHARSQIILRKCFQKKSSIPSEEYTACVDSDARHRARRSLDYPFFGPSVTDAGPLQASAFAFANSLTSGELELGPRHYALIEGAGQAVAAVTDVWRTVQSSNHRVPKGASDARKRARAMMLAGTLNAPAATLHAQTEHLEVAAFEYVKTLRMLLEVSAVVPGVDRASLMALNEVYSGTVAATFAEMVSAFTDKRAQAVTFPKRHPNLTRFSIKWTTTWGACRSRLKRSSSSASLKCQPRSSRRGSYPTAPSAGYRGRGRFDRASVF